MTAYELFDYKENDYCSNNSEPGVSGVRSGGRSAGQSADHLLNVGDDHLQPRCGRSGPDGVQLASGVQQQAVAGGIDNNGDDQERRFDRPDRRFLLDQLQRSADGALHHGGRLLPGRELS